jgi:hypothetical protein
MSSLFDIFDAPAPLSKPDEQLIAAFVAAGRSLDDLPYTLEFDALIKAMSTVGDKRSPQELLHRLHNLRKAKRLPALGRASTPSVKVSLEEELYLRDRVITLVGSLGARDNLPYTDKMDELVREFNAFSGRHLTAHDVWRLVAKVAK